MLSKIRVARMHYRFTVFFENRTQCTTFGSFSQSFTGLREYRNNRALLTTFGSLSQSFTGLKEYWNNRALLTTFGCQSIRHYSI